MKKTRRTGATKGSDSITLGSELKRLFPNGTRDPNDWSIPPQLPVEIFGAVAHLLEASSAYTYIVAPFAPTRGNPAVTYSGATQALTEGEVVAWVAPE